MCKWFIGMFVVLYALALALLAIGMFGLFGQPLEPLAGIYVILLGIPWSMAIIPAPPLLSPWLGALAPMVNLGLFIWLCRRKAAKQG